MHFSPGKIQQRVRSAQRFSHLKCIEFITYSQPTVPRRPTYPSPPLPPSSTTCFHVLVILAFPSSPPRLFRPKTRLKIKSRWKNSGMLLRRGAARRGDVRFVPVRFAPREFSLAVHRLSIFAPRILKITAVERIPSHRDAATRISRGESRSRVGAAYSFCPARPLFPRPLCAKPRGRVGV